MKAPAPARVVLLAAGVSLVLGGCARSPEARGILLITLDTTRADRIGCYGDAAAATPSLDGLAAAGVRFDEAMAPLATTLPSHSSMFTGRYPPAHGVRYNGMFRLHQEAVTVAETLRDAGWATAAVPAAFPVSATTGIAQGFEHYDDVFRAKAAEGERPKQERSAAEVTEAGLAWLGKVGDRRFFLWLHYYDPHFPYQPPFPFSSQFRDRPYDGEIAYMDREIGKVLAWLREQGLWERILIVAAGDHGEGLYDHGEMTHSNLTYQSTLRVPLILKVPGRARPRVVREPVSLVDVGPTLLDFAGAPGLPGADGISLRAAAAGREPPRRALYFESLVGSLVFGWSPIEGIRRARFKLIRSSAPELYDLEADPEEKVNLYANERALAADLEQTLQVELSRLLQDAAATETVAAPVDPEEMERLASLGYIGGTIAPERRGGPNPRDMIRLEGDIVRGRELMLMRDFPGALAVWGGILKVDAGNQTALLNAAVAAARLGRLGEALRFGRELVDRYPESLPGAVLLGEIHVLRKDLGSAVDTFRAGLTRHPGDVGLTHRLSVALLASDRVQEASREIEAALGRGAPEPALLVGRALCRARSGNPEGALEALREAISRGYRDREVLEKEPIVAPLRALPGFQSLLESIPKA